MTADVIEVEGGEVVLLSDPSLTADVISATGSSTVVVNADLGAVQLVGAGDTVVVAEPTTAPSVFVSDQGAPGDPGTPGQNGRDGQDGAAGPQGPPGAPGDVPTVYTQLTPAALWDITHDRFFPVVTVVDSAGSTVVGDVRHLASNHLQITFGAAFAGLAYLTS